MGEHLGHIKLGDARGFGGALLPGAGQGGGQGHGGQGGQGQGGQGGQGTGGLHHGPPRDYLHISCASPAYDHPDVSWIL